MKQRKIIAGVEIANSKRVSKEIRSALNWLDVKILEYRISADTVSFNELAGILKFLYVSEVITADEFNAIVETIVGEDIEEVPVL